MGELGAALITLIENMASAPQILAVLLLEGTRIVYRRNALKPSRPRPDIKRYGFLLGVWPAGLNAAPSVGSTVSNFLVRF